MALPSLRVALIGEGATLKVRSILDALWVALKRKLTNKSEGDILAYKGYLLLGARLLGKVRH